MPARGSRRRPLLKACLHCGALVFRDVEVCPVCGGTRFTDEWEGMVIILDENSYVARVLERKPGIYAIKVAGRVVARH
ncbi:transcription elongation factor subunit Spt4 [Stetteria hydrogenophila]